MRNLIVLLAGFLVLTTSETKAFQQQEQTDLFTIYIGAFVQADINDFKKLRPYGYLYAERLDNNLQRIYMGEYDNELAANKILDEVKKSGYPDSYLMKKQLKEGDELAVIQLASGSVGDDIDWKRLDRAGDLFTVIYNDKLKIVTGPFVSKDAARKQLKFLRTIGFADAFAKGVNSSRLHKAGAFETGGVKTSTILANDEAIVEEYEDVGEPFEVVAEKPKEQEVIPESYSEDIAVKSVSTTLKVPKIRSKVKRESVKKLQQVLKGQGLYKTSVDGFYGKATTAAFQKAQQENRHYRKYKLLSQHTTELPKSSNALQHYINTLLDDTPSAVQGLTTSKHTMAKVYLAYASFQEKGENKETDDLMNKAIKETFVGKKLKNKPPFDFNASYAYKDFMQLIQHLKYIQSAVKDEPAVPCWLFQRHPAETQKAFEPYSSLSTDDYRIQNCDRFMDWEELKLLSEMSKDLSNGDVDKKAIQLNQNKRTRLFLAIRPLDADKNKSLKKWDTDFWESFDTWANKDPLHDKMVDALKLTYFQSQILLEDYFMDKGYNADEANGLTLYTLQTIVEPYLEEYYK